MREGLIGAVMAIPIAWLLLQLMTALASVQVDRDWDDYHRYIDDMHGIEQGMR